MVEIHKTAIVDKNAELEEGVKIGPFAFIDRHVKIGKGTEIGQGVSIVGWTRIGSNCIIHMGASIGEKAQTRDQQDVRSYVKIGNNNTIREYTTIHRGMEEGGTTSIGDNNFIMANAHIAHDCKIGNGVTITNLSLLGGHVEVEDQAFISSLVGIHQFVRVGRLSMIGGYSRLTKDAPPYMVIEGRPAMVYGLNIVGLRRAGMSIDTRNELKKAFRILFNAGLNISEALKRIGEELPKIEEICHLVEFIRNSKRGICRPRRIHQG